MLRRNLRTYLLVVWHKFLPITLLYALWVIPIPCLGANENAFTVFDKIYCINLERSVERRKHIINEFQRVGIEDYELFKATDMNSAAVAQAMQTDFVKKYPPCFRCKKIFCKCENNVLIKQQVGNWISFIRVFKDIVANNYNLILITEDDIKFKDNAQNVIKYITDPQVMSRYKINQQKPLLIRLEDRGQTRKGKDSIGLVKEVVMSNACFIVNRQFAESFLRNLQQIDHTSDVFIQHKLLFLDPTIQHFTAYPAPSFQLSDNSNATFYSEIHPKGIDAVDEQRKKLHKKRISLFEYLLQKIGWRQV